MKWQHVVVACWMLFMFILQALSAYWYREEHGGTSRGRYFMVLMAGSWLFIAAVLHSGGFW